MNRAIDARLREIGWHDVEALLRDAGIARVSRVLAIAKETVKAARAHWPALLVDAPDNVRASVEGRLAGGLALTRPG